MADDTTTTTTEVPVTTTTTTVETVGPSEAQIAKDRVAEANSPVLGDDEQTKDELLNGARGEALASHREANTETGTVQE